MLYLAAALFQGGGGAVNRVHSPSALVWKYAISQKKKTSRAYSSAIHSTVRIRGRLHFIAALTSNKKELVFPRSPSIYPPDHNFDLRPRCCEIGMCSKKTLSQTIFEIYFFLFYSSRSRGPRLRRHGPDLPLHRAHRHHHAVLTVPGHQGDKKFKKK